MNKFKVGDIIYDPRPGEDQMRGKICKVGYHKYFISWIDDKAMDFSIKWIDRNHIVCEESVVDRILRKYNNGEV